MSHNLDLRVRIDNLDLRVRIEKDGIALHFERPSSMSGEDLDNLIRVLEALRTLDLELNTISWEDDE